MLALTVAVLLSAYTWDAFLFPLQASYVGVCTAAAGAFLLATGRELSPGRIVGVAALSLLATYSIGSGLLVPLLVLLVGVLRGLSKRRVIALGGIAAAAFATYFATFEMPVYDLPFDEAPSGVVDVLAYSLVFLGGPLSLPWEATRVTAATVIGGVGIALLAIVLITRMRQPRRVDPADWALPAVAVFAVGSAGLAAVGRAPLGLASALEPRYGSPAMLLWCALFGEGMRAHRRTVARPALAFGAGALSLYLATLQDDLEERGRQALRRFPEAESALLAGALDAHVVAGTTLPHYVTERIAALRRERLSVFAEPWASWYGRPIADYRTPAAAGACIGYLGAVTPVISYAAPAFRARGWAFDLRRGEPVARLVLVDDQGRVVGYAIGGRPRPDVEKVMPNVTSRTTGFVGHLGKLERDEVRVRALALVQGDEVCPLEPELTVRMADAAALVIPESQMP
jgi:hypothetical protein